MTDWKQHDGGPQPVDDDVWICTDAMPAEMEEVGAGYVRLPKQVGEWKHVTGFFVLNQHLIDAARLEGIRLGLEAAAQVADHDWPDPNSPIRRLDPDTIAREAVLDQLTSEAQADSMGYEMDEMELFLVRATIARTEYMDDESQFEDIRLVKASGDREVEQKYYRYWESRGSAFGTSYRVVEFDAQETIG